MNTPTWIKPGLIGAAVGIAVIAIVGFSAGWVVSGGKADKMAQERAEAAVMAALTPICVAQFKSASSEMQSTQLAALEDESSWQRGDYVEEHGWATMPGSQKPNDEVADACATELMKLTSE